MTTFMRNIWLTSPMMRGGDIVQIQSRLNNLGANLSCDGVYGRGTRNAILAFQKRNNALTQDGVVGIQTWAVLFAEPGPVIADRVVGDILDEGTLAKQSSFHSFFANSVRWQMVANGLLVEGDAAPVFGSGETEEVSKVFGNYGDALTTILSIVQVPVELVIACICTESSGRAAAERHEKGCSTIDPALTPSRVSVGLMQTLLSTASSVMPKPVSLADLRNPLVSIEAGSRYMWRQARATRFDPPLVACAYNAGSLIHNTSPDNRWKLLQYPTGTSEYADRFIRLFNAAMNLPEVGQKVKALGGRVASLRPV
jgi:hypothetical protein